MLGCMFEHIFLQNIESFAQAINNMFDNILIVSSIQVQLFINIFPDISYFSVCVIHDNLDQVSIAEEIPWINLTAKDIGNIVNHF